MRYVTLVAALCAAALLFAVKAETAQAASAQACHRFASNYAHNASRQGQVVRRGLFGSLLGVGIGAATGGAAAGAAIGGGVGALSGTHARQREADRLYHAAFRDCMAGRVR